MREFENMIKRNKPDDDDSEIYVINLNYTIDQYFKTIANHMYCLN